MAYGIWVYRTRRKQMRERFQILVPIGNIYMYLDIGFSLFDSYVIVNAYIAWKNHVLKGEPKAHHARKKYQIRQVRLNLIHRWTKRCSRHYEATQPHRQKRLRTVNTFLKEPQFVWHYKAMEVSKR